MNLSKFKIKDTGIIGGYQVFIEGVNNPEEHSIVKNYISSAISNVIDAQRLFFLLNIKELHSGKEVACKYTISVSKKEDVDKRILRELKSWRGDEDQFVEINSIEDEFESDGVVWFLENHYQITKEEYDVLNKFNI